MSITCGVPEADGRNSCDVYILLYKPSYWFDSVSAGLVRSHLQYHEIQLQTSILWAHEPTICGVTAFRTSRFPLVLVNVSHLTLPYPAKERTSHEPLGFEFCRVCLRKPKDSSFGRIPANVNGKVQETCRTTVQRSLGPWPSTAEVL